MAIITPKDEKDRLKILNIKNYTDHFSLFKHLIKSLESFAPREELLYHLEMFSKEELEKLKNK